MPRLIVLNFLAASASICSYFCGWFETIKDKPLKNSGRLYFEEISVHLSKFTDHCAFCPGMDVSFGTIVDKIINGKRCFCVFTLHIAKRKLQDSVKFQQETLISCFQPQPELVLKMFLIFVQSEPLIVLIKKHVLNKSFSCILIG